MGSINAKAASITRLDSPRCSRSICHFCFFLRALHPVFMCVSSLLDLLISFPVTNDSTAEARATFHLVNIQQQPPTRGNRRSCRNNSIPSRVGHYSSEFVVKQFNVVNLSDLIRLPLFATEDRNERSGRPENGCRKASKTKQAAVLRLYPQWLCPSSCEFCSTPVVPYPHTI